MGKTLVHLPSPSQKRAFLLMMARALHLKQAGEDVAVGHCALAAGTCAANLSGSRLVCRACRSSTRSSVAGTGLELIPLGVDAGDAEENERSTSDAADLTIGGFREASELADGVNSCLVTVLRVITRDVKKIAPLRAIKRRYLNACRKTLRSVRNMLANRGFDRVETLNGRYACTKVGIIAARQLGKSYATLDFNLRGQPMLFDGYTPHDRLAVQKRVLKNDADEAAASDYYQARQSGRLNAFAKAHRGFEPPVTSSNGRKITFFLSSQDECESLGPSWRSPFRDVAGTVAAASERFPDDHFVVRFHPNQASILSDVSSPYAGVAGLPNVTIYWPGDTIDSYSLIEWSDAIVTFASTVAIESCWMGKPVFQLGPSYFDQLGISYTPADLDQFLSELEGPLEPFSKENAARYAVYETLDYDTLDFLDTENDQTIPIGFARKGTAYVKPAKEWNNAVISMLKRFAASKLSANRAA